MNILEIDERLADGEHPITLSLIHWQRNLERLLAGQEMLVGGNHCALCQTHPGVGGCITCPLYVYTGDFCDDADALYATICCATCADQLQRAVEDMIEALTILDANKEDYE